MNILKKLQGLFKRKKTKKAVRKRIIDIINAERATVLTNDRALNAAMKLVAGAPLSRSETSTAVKSGAFGNAFGGRLTATYDAAQTNTDNRKHWNPADALAADAANSPEVRKVLRQRARYENANNCTSKGIGESISLDTIGTGPSLQIDDIRVTSMDRTIIEAAFNSWLKKVGMAKKLRTMRRARRVDGEAIAVEVNNKNLNHPVQLDIRLIETEMMSTPGLTQPDARHIDGIDLDENGFAEKYVFLQGHPGDPGQLAESSKSIQVDPIFVTHWFRQDRAGQHRGVSEMTAGLPLYSMHRRYNLAVVQAAETAADFALWMGTTNGAEGMNENDDVVNVPEEFDLFPLERNIVTTLPDGYTIGQTKPEQPINTHDKFVIALIREIARNESVPLGIALGDTQGNFSSGNLDYRIYYRPREIERSELENDFLDKLFVSWLQEALKISDYLPETLDAIALEFEISHSWNWDSNELGDPMKLAASKSTRLKSGLLSIPEDYASRNKDWRKEFTVAAESLGVTFEEYQTMVRESIFSNSVDDSSEEVDEDENEEDENVEPTRQQPNQQAVRKANQ